MLQTKVVTSLEGECYFEKVMSSKGSRHHHHHSLLQPRSSTHSPPLPDSIVAQAGDVESLLPEVSHHQGQEDYYYDNDTTDCEDYNEEDNKNDKKDPSEVLDENANLFDQQVSLSTANKLNNSHSFKWEEVIWKNVLLIGAIHLVAGYALWSYTVGAMKWQNILVSYAFGALSAFGVTVGAHRLWAHRSFKAKWPLRLLLAFCNTCAMQTDIYDWCRDHRVHHRFSETNADPHNSNRGFFFAHCGWLMLPKHPEVTRKGRTVDLSDVLADPIVRFQRRWYLPLGILCWAILPTLAGVWLLDETAWNSFLLSVMYRYAHVLNLTWNVNSGAHLFGNRPYSVKINPRENKLVTYLSFGEGYHNYHHAFPYDYSASEFGLSGNFNLSTMVIELFAKVGLAYDLRKPSPEVVKRKAAKEGDQTLGSNGNLIGTIIDWLVGLFFATLACNGTLFVRAVYNGGLYNVV